MSKLWPPAPPAATPLGRYRVLSPLAGIRVSPIQLGAMSIGDEWQKLGMGAMDKEASFKLLDAYYDAGGNFIDTANNYQDRTSEMFIGEWAEKRGIRDQLVIATKYTNNFHRGEKDVKIKINYSGNNVKSLKLSLDESLKNLRTDYIDIMYVHMWDHATSMEEVMDSLHNLVVAGKILYLGASNMPAWVVSAANTYAKLQGKTPFVIYQGAWNVMERSFERDIVPMARAHGLALAPFDVLAGGRLRSDAEDERRAASGENGRMLFAPDWKRTDTEKKMSAALEKVAKEVGTEHVSAVAIAYVMHRVPYCFPIIGQRKVEHLTANIEALKIKLSNEQVKYLESIVPFNPGFPTNVIGNGSFSLAAMFASEVEDLWPASQTIKH